MDRVNPETFWSKVRKGPGCWEWTAYRNGKGYGHFMLARAPGQPQRCVKAHRIAWLLTRGPIPNNLCLLHRCDNAACVRPDHMFFGIRADNNLDMLQKGRNARGERHSSSRLTDEAVRRIRLLRQRGLKQEDIAIAFGVTQSTVSNVVLGKRWTHVDA